MSEQKGSYAHVGLPGLRQLFAGSGKGMKEIGVTISRLSDELLEELENHISELHDEYGLDTDGMHSFQLLSVGYSAAWDEVERLNQQLTEKDEAIEYLRRNNQEWQTELMEANSQLTEKDATIKELQDEVKKWRTQAEAKILFVSNGNNERMHELQEDNISLRKALEEAKENIRLIDVYGERPSSVTSYCDTAIDEINAALGEGDKDGN